MRAGLSHQEHALKPEKAASGRFFTVQRLSRSEKVLRFSCIISKKVAQRAVDRNRLRRQTRSAFRSLGPPGLFVIHIKKPAATAPFNELVRELAELSQKIV